ncbi:MAG: DUF6089 family protein [Leadbetterella sp.]
MKKLALLTLTYITFLSVQSYAQDQCKICKPYPWEIGAMIGPNQYFGDMHCSKPYRSQTGIMGGIFARRHLNDFFSLRPQFLIANKLAGADLDRPDDRWDYRNASFKAKGFMEAALLAEYYPFRERRFSCDGTLKKGISPYLFAGIGAAYGRPKLEQTLGRYTGPDGGSYPIFPLDPTGVQQDKDAVDGGILAGIVPVGLGFKYNFTNRATLGAEAGYRFSFSDLLDGMKYSAYNVGVPLQEGKRNRNDGYFLGTLMGSYRFGDKDTDKDGTVDKCDACVSEPGLSRYAGCPDTDGDGTIDKDDLCPTVAGPMGLKGCPDTDGDGIADKDDACPTQVGSALLQGCPDRDFDGVPDKDDACPDQTGVKELKGCPDTDGDGIADKDDACPNQAGPASLNGCPDTDGDGIADSNDDCINVKGLASANGCPDTDGDGIPDNKDKCPTVAGIAANNGCPEGYVNGVAGASGFRSASGCVITNEEIKQLSFASKGIEFYPGTNKLKPSSYKSLQRVCDVLGRCKDATMAINCYNDGGSDSQNLRLAKLRACAIYSYFMKKKCISKSRMTYAGFGDEDPSSPYTSASGSNSGSRVEFILK